MGDCNTNQTAGCGENKDSIQVTKTIIKLDPILTDLEDSVTDIKNALYDFCQQEGANLDIIKAKLEILLANNIECCLAINAKLHEMGDILENLDHVTTTTTTHGAEYPCGIYWIDNTGAEDKQFLRRPCDSEEWTLHTLPYQTAYASDDCEEIMFMKEDDELTITRSWDCDTTTTTISECYLGGFIVCSLTEPTTTTTTLEPCLLEGVIECGVIPPN